MIVISLQGGLGNQMFQFATAYALAKRNNTRLLLCTDLLDMVDSGITKREFELGIYRLKAESANPYKSNTLLNRIRKKIRVLDVYYERGLNFDDKVLTLKKHSLLEGYFQCEMYFNSIRREILNKFTFPELSTSGKSVLMSIQSAMKCTSVHVRRGDYLSNKSAAEVHGVLPIDYYLRAIKQLKNDEMTFFVFSDDLIWCMEAFKGHPINIHFVENTEEMAPWEDMYLMSMCDNQIIANSSYSWWGAWLNRNSSKKVIAPKDWFVDKNMNESHNIIPESWIKL